jgi:hypothetical protein
MLLPLPQFLWMLRGVKWQRPRKNWGRGLG